MNRTTAFVTVSLIAVILAAVLSLNVFFKDRDDPAETAAPPAETLAPPRDEATEPPAVVLTPTPTPPPATAAPVTPPPATAAPATPAPTPTATPAPTPPPVQASASGSFSSSTGTALNLVCDWKAYTDAAGASKLQVDVSVSSYRFNTDAIYAGLTLNVNGAVYSKNSPAVRYEGDTVATTYLTSFTVDAPSGASSLSVTWDYKGSYSGVDLSSITAYGQAYIG